jgi:hypothetical protein
MTQDATDGNMAGDAERTRPNLLYTVAFDAPGLPRARQMAKMLAGSVVRTLFNGEMSIYHNSPQPVLLLGRPGVGEFSVETPPLESGSVADFARAWKAQAAPSISPEQYRWIVFLDADCLCLRNIDHLLADRGCDILYQTQSGRSIGEAEFCGYLTEAEGNGPTGQRGSGERRGRIAGGPGEAGGKPPPQWGINSGTWAVRGNCYRAVMESWARIHRAEPLRETSRREQSAWNRLILDAAQNGWRAEPFEAHEVQFPLANDKDWKLYKDAAIVHLTGGTSAEKIEFMFGLFMQRFLFDPACTLLNVVEM